MGAPGNVFGKTEPEKEEPMRTSGARIHRVLLFVVLVTAAALAAAASAAGAGKDFVNGGFEDHFGENVGLHAASGPAGETPSGHESATRPGDTRYRLRVTCLAVEGNLAAYGTVIVKSNNPDYPAGTEFVEVVRDSGLPGGRGDGWELFEEPAATCADFVAAAATAPEIGHGNISVHDAQS
jgi:predicted small secreted protein